MSSRLLAAGIGFVSVIAAHDGRAAELPRPCAAGSCGPQVAAWVTSGTASATSTADTLRITQHSDRAILNWASFDVSADGHVIFQQPGVNSIALNRIHQASPSRIFGTIDANGQIYLINQNGFLFGAGARVKAAGLLVSTLNLSDSVFNAGLLAPRGDSAALEAELTPDGRPRVEVIGADGKPVLGPDGKPLLVKLVVAEGAKLTTTNDGRALLAGQIVDNAGTIETPGGQVVMAAGTKVYLQASTDPALRGILVEVDGDGETWNRLTGHLDAARGNITVAGLAVNQQGRISATTTVASNGSVRLQARSTIDHTKALSGVLASTQGGRLELGSHSSIEVLPDLADTATAVDDQTQLASSVDLSGKAVFIRGGSSIKAPGGTLQVTAASNPSQPTLGDDSRIRIDDGAQIDLAGSSVTLPVTRAMVQVELRANELKDSPNQRNGALRGQRVTIDARVGTPLADVSGALAAVPKGIAERTSTGGTVNFDSQGDVVVATGAHIDVSGGKIQYEAGTIQTTQLMGADGKLYDIGSADPLRTYVAAINPTYTRRFDRWGVIETLPSVVIGRDEPGYIEGRSAGTIRFLAPNMVLNGTLLGNATAGVLQRDPAKVPKGGQLVIGTPVTGSAPRPNYVAPSVDLVNERPSIVITDDASLPRPRTLELPIDFMAENGFTRTEIYSNGVVTLQESTPLTLLPGSSLKVVAERINLLSDITAPGGSLTMTADQTLGVPGLIPPRAGVRVADGVTLDVRGQWTNDALAVQSGTVPRSPVFKDGGEIDLGLTTRDLDQNSLFDAEVVLGSNVNLLAGGGGWLQAKGALVGGKGGRIALRSGRIDFQGTQSAFEVGDHVRLDAFGVEGAQGGRFQLETQRIEILTDSVWAKAQRLDAQLEEDGVPFLQLGSALFSDSGFASINLLATGAPLPPTVPENGAPPERVLPDTLVVRSGVTLDTRVRTRQVQESARTRISGGTVDDITNVALAPLPVNRQASSVSLRAIRQKDALVSGRLSLEQGSVLLADARSSFNFEGLGGVLLAGQILAPSGSIRAFVDNPPLTNDPGFVPDQMVEVTSTAWLDVSGTALLKVDDAGRSSGDVLAGGTIGLLANRGAVVVRDGARVDVSGTSATIDFADATRHTVASAAGALELRAPESIQFLGDLRAAAGTGDTGRAAGGSLSVELTRHRGFQQTEATTPAPSNPRVLRVVSDSVASGSLPSGLALLETRTIANSGIDALRLESDGSVELTAGVGISLARELTIDSPLVDLPVGGSVSLSAPHVVFGNSLTDVPNLTVAPGGGTLNVRGDLIELLGFTSLQHVGSALFDSTGDIRMRGVLLDNAYTGGLKLAGDLTLRAQRVYPTTDTHFSITASGGANDIVRIEQAAAKNENLPLSVAGSIQIAAKQIVQDGTLLAPFGSLTLSASDELHLTSRSVTSVSGNGALFPFGQVQLGEWQYLSGIPVTQSAIPDRRIELRSDQVDLANGATVDLRGGGDLFAYEWIPGTGGSKDALAPGVIPGLYAIVPGMGDTYAPFDPAEFTASDLKVGDSIYLSGGGGLAAGTYALLPARYALLPGSYLVQAVAGSKDFTPGSSAVLGDGTPVVGGYRTFGATGLGDTRFSGFSIRPGTYGRQLAAYDVSLASQFFPALAQSRELDRAALPADAGSLALIAGTRLDARGKVLSAAATGGRGASIDVAAKQMEITGANAASSSAVQLSAQVLQQWNPSQLLLGGVRSADGSVDVLADSVLFKDGAELSLDQLLAVAINEIGVEQGAVLKSSSAARNQAVDALKLPQTALALHGAAAEAAVLGVSDLAAIDVQRTHDAGATATGRISIGSGALVTSRGDLLLDAPAGGTLVASALDGRGAAWQLSSGRIAFGTDEIDDGFAIDNSLFARLNQGAAARFAGNTLEFHDSVQLGGVGSALQEISLTGAAIQASASDIDVALAASKLSLRGASGGTSSPATGTGTLRLTGTDVGIGPGTLTVDGFTATTIDAAARLRGEGEASLSVGGDLTLNAGTVSGASQANVFLTSSGTLRINGASGPAAASLPATDELGGALTLAGRDIVHAGSIVMPSGVVTLQADNQLSVLGGALIDVSGRTVTAGGRSVSSSGGSIILKARGDATQNFTGDVSVAQGSTLRVDGAGGADAGDISVRSAGTATIAGLLQGRTGTSARGGSFDLTAGQLASFSLLNQQLEAGGFTENRSIATALGDFTLGAGESIHARSVSLTTDGGRISIGGSIDALSDAERSKIELYGRNGVSIESTGALRANGVGAKGKGGEITLGSSSGPVAVGVGSLVSAKGEAEAGKIRIRAPLVGSDVNIAQLGGRFEGPSAITIEPVVRFDNVAATQTAATMNSFRTQVTNLLNATAVGAMRARLQTPNGPTLSIEPGIELRRDGDLTFNLGQTALNLATWRFNTNPDGATPAEQLAPAALTVRATGSITVNGVLSDGFDTVGSAASARLQLRNDASATLRFAAGSSLDSANPLALRTDMPGNFAADFVLGANSVVRTGTGDLSVAALRDVKFNGNGASLYTGGNAGSDFIPLVVPSTVSFPTRGGNLSISAGRDLIGRPLQSQSIAAWQSRARNGQPAAWGADINRFAWNAGTLGGGDLAVRAGRNIMDLSAAAANSGRVADGKLAVLDGGHLSVSSGGDIASAVVHVSSGYNTIKAHGKLTSSREVGGVPTGSLLFMQNDAKLAIDARAGVLLESVFNPTSLSQVSTVPVNQRTSYFTYDEASALNVRSVAGDVVLQYSPERVRALLGVNTGDFANNVDSALPPSATLHSLSGDVRFAGPTTLFQSDAGQLDIFAARDIIATGTVAMPSTLAAATAAPLQPSVQRGNPVSARHQNDAQPVLITAGRDIAGGRYALPKALEMFAGRDISDIILSSQNLRPGDVTRIVAGRDLRYSTSILDGKIEVGGPGRLDVVAGRNVDLGFSSGITTDGRIRDPEIESDVGADLTVIAGSSAAIDGTGFLKDVVGESDDYRATLIAYVERETGASGLTYASALERFNTLQPNDQRPLLLELFFRELVKSGREANADPTVGFKRGFAAIDSLFPGSRRPEDATEPGPFAGDITLTFSRIYTLAGGTISLLAPGGLLNVGLANPPATLGTREPSLLGIVAQSVGDVRIFTNDDVLVNASRVFTLGGGDIAIWSTSGDIDAGRGAKSAVSAPPPVVLINSQGQVVANFAGAVAGSGIRTIAAGEGVKPGNVDLIAPAGIVNAGDAGIGAAGNLNVAAQQVVGLDNIQVGGTSTGVPAETSGLGVSLSAASSVASSASSAADSSLNEGAGAAQAAPLAEGALGWLDVFIEGFGEEVCKPSDTACLDRNKRKP